MIHTKSCGVNIKDGRVVIFHGKERIVIDPKNSGSVTLAEEMVWRIRNEAELVGENRTKIKIKDLLTIKPIP